MSKGTAQLSRELFRHVTGYAPSAETRQMAANWAQRIYFLFPILASLLTGLGLLLTARFLYGLAAVLSISSAIILSQLAQISQMFGKAKEDSKTKTTLDFLSTPHVWLGIMNLWFGILNPPQYRGWIMCAALIVVMITILADRWSYKQRWYRRMTMTSLIVPCAIIVVIVVISSVSPALWIGFKTQFLMGGSQNLRQDQLGQEYDQVIYKTIRKCLVYIDDDGPTNQTMVFGPNALVWYTGESKEKRGRLYFKCQRQLRGFQEPDESLPMVWVPQSAVIRTTLSTPSPSTTTTQTTTSVMTSSTTTGGLVQVMPYPITLSVGDKYYNDSRTGPDLSCWIPLPHDLSSQEVVARWTNPATGKNYLRVRGPQWFNPTVIVHIWVDA